MSVIAGAAVVSVDDRRLILPELKPGRTISLRVNLLQ
jgi:hypothetical protein